MAFRRTDPDHVIGLLGRRVAELRAVRGFTQREFAARAGLSDRYLQRVEAGTENLTVRTLVKLSNAFSVPLVELLAPPTMPRARLGRPRRERAKIVEVLELKVADVLAITGSVHLTELIELTRTMTPTQMQLLLREAKRIAPKSKPED